MLNVIQIQPQEGHKHVVITGPMFSLSYVSIGGKLGKNPEASFTKRE